MRNTSASVSFIQSIKYIIFILIYFRINCIQRTACCLEWMLMSTKLIKNLFYNVVFRKECVAIDVDVYYLLLFSFSFSVA